MIKSVDADATVTIATSENQVGTIQSQLEDSVRISIEPCRRDTFPAIALATAYLHDRLGISRDDAVVVCPVDPYVDLDYFQMLSKLNEKAKSEVSNLTLMGTEPTYISFPMCWIKVSSCWDQTLMMNCLTVMRRFQRFLLTML